jgi:Flp pilus assembly protein TadD
MALESRGAVNDPRTFALYLASRGTPTECAVRLAETELQSRADVFTHDALAWALLADGKTTEAQRHIVQALAEGTQDARLFYHAGMIANATGKKQESRAWLEKARALAPMLMPSEKKQLITALTVLSDEKTKLASQNLTPSNQNEPHENHTTQ